MAIWNEVFISNIREKERFDADYFQKHYIELDKFVGEGLPISIIADTVDLQSNGAFKQIYNILNDNNKKEVPYIRSGNVGDFFLNKNELQMISKKAHSLLIKTHTKKGDVLMARKGKIGGATLITEEDVELNSNDNVVNIRIKDQRYMPEYFVAFWNSKFGLDQVKRLSTGNVQPWLSMKQVRMLKTVLLDHQYQKEISEIVKLAHSKYKLSRVLSDKAHYILNKELGLEEINITSYKNYEVNFSEIIDSRRIDAQCFKPDYVDYEKHIRKKGSFDYLGNVIDYSVKGQQAKVDICGELEYVSIKDIQGIEIYSKEKCKRSPRLKIAEKYNLLLAITGATIGKIGMILRSDEVAFSGDLLLLKINNNIDPFYFLAVMSNTVGQSQCQRWITGSTNGHLSPVDVNKIVIPRISINLEKKIAKLLKDSIQNMFESEKLLKEAKRKVECFIESSAVE